jgi:D-alanine-D-alanine ligase
VVRNRVDPSSRRPGYALRSVQKIVDALRNRGYVVRVIEGDSSMLRNLRRFLPRDPETGACDGIVLNLSHGGRGDAPTTQVPAVLEMSGFAYSGPTPLGHATMVDAVLARIVLQRAGVPTPAFRVVATHRDPMDGLGFPAIVRPRHEPGARPIIVADDRQLRRAVRRLVRTHRQEVIVEERVKGRHIVASLLGNDPVECLPLVEIDSSRGEKICPSALSDGVADQLRAHALGAFRACGGRDYARVDLRVGDSGTPHVLEIRTLGILAHGGAFARAGAEAGYSFEDLLARIVELTRRRARAGDPSFAVSRTEEAIVRG